LSTAALDSSPQYRVGDTLWLSWTVDTMRLSACAVEASMDSGTTWHQLGGSLFAPLPGSDTVRVPLVLPDTLGGAPSSSAPWTLRVKAPGQPIAVEFGSVLVSEPILVLEIDVFSDTLREGDTLHARCRFDTARVTSPQIRLVPVGDSVSYYAGVEFGAHDDSGWVPLQWVVHGVGDSGLLAEGDYLVWLCSATDDTCSLAGDTLRVRAEAVAEEEPDEPVDDSDCGCGTGTGLALLPPLWYRLRRRRRVRRTQR
jgi:hypothetical protein